MESVNFYCELRANCAEVKNIDDYPLKNTLIKKIFHKIDYSLVEIRGFPPVSNLKSKINGLFCIKSIILIN